MSLFLLTSPALCNAIRDVIARNTVKNVAEKVGGVGDMSSQDSSLLFIAKLYALFTLIHSRSFNMVRKETK